LKESSAGEAVFERLRRAVDPDAVAGLHEERHLDLQAVLGDCGRRHRAGRGVPPGAGLDVGHGHLDVLRQFDADDGTVVFDGLEFEVLEQKRGVVPDLAVGQLELLEACPSP
jgi:hypothetical protein